MCVDIAAFCLVPTSWEPSADLLADMPEVTNMCKLFADDAKISNYTILKK